MIFNKEKNKTLKSSELNVGGMKMAVFKCKMCGGNLEVQEGMTVCECEYCGSTQTVPVLDVEKKITLFTRANRLRSACEFDKASGVYESIVAEFPDEAEAYWGLILCKYGIEYIDDTQTGKKIPTCHRSSFDSVMDDENFELVMEYSEQISRSVYREEAKKIEELRVGIIEVSSREEPYDIFICYKESDSLGERTIDSVIAQDVYDVLAEKGYKVFFSRITLEDKLGQEYEPYIFAALNSAKVMLVFGTDYEYYNAVWVKNEWSRFLNLIEKGEKKTLIPCYKGIDAYDMPKEFARLQAQDMGKVGAIQDLVRGIGKILGNNTVQSNSVFNVASAEGSLLTQRGNMALEDGDFKGAEGYFERALDTNPADAHAYLGKFLALYGLKSLSDLDDKICLLEENKEFRRAEQFADAKLANELKNVRQFNSLKLERMRFIDILKKHQTNQVVLELDNMKCEALHSLMECTSEGEKKARDIYSAMLNANIITDNEYARMIERIAIVNAIACLLSDYKMHAKASLGLDRIYSSTETIIVLRNLIQYKCIEEYDDGYCLVGVKQKEERQKEAYNVACAKIEEQIQTEALPIINSITTEFDIKIQGLQIELNEAIDAVNRKREETEKIISDLRSKQCSLGFFKGKEKKMLQVQIDETQNTLNTLATQQQIQSEYQQRINKLVRDRQAAVDGAFSDIRKNYIMPKYEDYIE